MRERQERESEEGMERSVKRETHERAEKRYKDEKRDT